MKDLDARHLLKRMNELSAVAPEPSATARVLAAARRHSLRNRVARYALAGGLAAAIGVAVIAGITALTQQTATAADLLRQAVDTTKAYRGWVTQRTSIDGKDAYEFHTDSQTGTWADVRHEGGALWARLDRPAEREESAYDATSRTIRVGEFDAERAQQQIQAIARMPWTVGEAMNELPDAQVIRSNDGPWVKFEVTTPKDPHATASPTTRPHEPERICFWEDPQTHLIRKAEMFSYGRQYHCDITYGGPPIRTLYDLGTPRDAAIVDVRPTPELKQLLDRLQTRYDAAFGDYVAVATTTTLDPDGKPDDQTGGLTLYARSGAAALSKRYVLGSAEKNGTSPDRPTGWPTPALDAVLATIQHAPTTTSIVSNGTDTWTKFDQSASDVRMPTTKREVLARMHPLARLTEIFSIPPHSWMPGDPLAMFALPAHIWPTRETLKLYGSYAKAELITDPRRPGLTGLRVDETTDAGGMRSWRQVTTYWLDPARDDVPVETERESRLIGFNNRSHELHTYSDWSLTTDGRWYPSAWRTTIEMNFGKSKSTTTETRLQIWTGRGLDAEWFNPSHGKTVPAAATAPSH